jgi:histidinol-phosphate aminotransferase
VLEQELKRLEIVKKVYPSDANFFLVEFSKKAGEIYKALIQTGVVTRNRSQFVANCLRISVGTKQENELLIKSLKEIK